MGYLKSLEQSIAWIKKTQNPDGGWGLSQGSCSSIVNTAEAIFILSKHNVFDNRQLIQAGIGYIENNTINQINLNPRTRYAIFGLLGVADFIDKTNSSFLSDCKNWLINARNDDGGWGHIANDNDSKLFSTCKAVIALNKIDSSINLSSSYNWIKSKFNSNGNGWNFFDSQEFSIAATSMAIVALRTKLPVDDSFLQRPKEILLSSDTNWLFNTEPEDICGAPWTHCTYMWAFRAMVLLEIEPFKPNITQTVRSINKLTTNHDGWKEKNGHLTVRGQYWAISALEALKNGFDPSVHPYWFDSYQAGIIRFKEPEFVITNPHFNWSFALPKQSYILFTYFTLCISIFFCLGVYREIPMIPRIGDLFISIIFFLIAFYLVKKRKHLFNKIVFSVLSGFLGLLELIGFIFGKSLFDLFNLLF